MSNRLSVHDLLTMKKGQQQITRAVVWDYTFGLLADRAGVEMVLVGDSLGMGVLGHENTLRVTMEDMVRHGRAVSQAVERAFVVVDMPFGSYENSSRRALVNARRLIDETGADAVKLEGGVAHAEAVRRVVDAGIPVHGHIGLTPQRVKELGGFRTQGKTQQSARTIAEDATALSAAGVFAMTIECVPPVVAEVIASELSDVVVMSAGAGAKCDGQSANLYDLLGLTQGKTPRFSRRYEEGGEMVTDALRRFVGDVQSGGYPSHEETYAVPLEQEAALRLEVLDTLKAPTRSSTMALGK